MDCDVLIVDDSPIQRTTIARALRLAGVPECRICEAADGREALELLESAAIGLVLLDLNMPVMDGEEFAKRMHERDDLRDIAIVVVSTECNRERLDRLRRYGVVGSLRKPFALEDLRCAIAEILGVGA